MSTVLMTALGPDMAACETPSSGLSPLKVTVKSARMMAAGCQTATVEGGLRVPSLQETCVESLVAAARQMQRTTAMLERENGDLLERKLRLQARANPREGRRGTARNYCAPHAPTPRIHPCRAASWSSRR